MSVEKKMANTMDAFIVDGKYVEKYEITNLTTKKVVSIVQLQKNI